LLIEDNPKDKVEEENAQHSGLAGTVRLFGQVFNPPTANANHWVAHTQDLFQSTRK
jgi:hypothetical protein